VTKDMMTIKNDQITFGDDQEKKIKKEILCVCACVAKKKKKNYVLCGWLMIVDL
jgi:hypothetical protein